MWGIIPAAGAGTRFSRWRSQKNYFPCAVSTTAANDQAQSSQRLSRGAPCNGWRKTNLLCDLAWKIRHSRILRRQRLFSLIMLCNSTCATGLCDSIFSALPVIDKHAPVLVGLPDTIWFPEAGLRSLPDDVFPSFYFRSRRPSHFDAVTLDDAAGCSKSGKAPVSFYALDLGRVQDAWFSAGRTFNLWCARNRAMNIWELW